MGGRRRLICFHRHTRSSDWRDARSDPVVRPFLYELRQVPVPPEHRQNFRRKDGRPAVNAVTWTWRIRRDDLDRLRACVRHWVQQRDERLRRLIRGLALAPPFRGVRDDIFSLHRYIISQSSERKVSAPDLPGRRWLNMSKGASFKTFPCLIWWREFSVAPRPGFLRDQKRQIPRPDSP